MVWKTMYQKTHFSFNFALDFIQLGFFSIKNRGVGGGGLLNGQNLLSVIKVIGWWSLKEKDCSDIIWNQKQTRNLKC